MFRSRNYYVKPQYTWKQAPPTLSPRAFPGAVQTPQSLLAVLTQVRWCRCLTPDENEPQWFLFYSFFLCSWPTLWNCSSCSGSHSPHPCGSQSLASPPTCSLVSGLGAILFLIALVANLVISQEPSKETGLLAGNSSSCWKGSKGSYSPILSFQRWVDGGLDKLYDVSMVTEPIHSKARSKAQVSCFSVQCNHYRLCWGWDGGIKTVKVEK